MSRLSRQKFNGIDKKDGFDGMMIDDVNARFLSSDMKIGTRHGDLHFHPNAVQKLKKMVKKSASELYRMRAVSSIHRKDKQVKSEI